MTKSNYSASSTCGKGLSRREFLRLATISIAGAAAGCAVNPVTGDRQLMLMSEEQEKKIDRQNSPHQFSADYGPIQDHGLNAYVTEVGSSIASVSHRPGMPYSFRVVNATYVNAYAFPGGSIAATRGILLEMDNEAELAAPLGHEIGHVNARHTAQRMSKQMLMGLAVVGVAGAVGMADDRFGGLAAGLGGIGAGLLLASYSRDDERQADSLGMEYMTKSGQSSKGMVGLMEMLMQQHKKKPNALQMMFSTHPMSDERYSTTRSMIGSDYAFAAGRPVRRERFKDKTAALRRKRTAIEALQHGEKAMTEKSYDRAEQSFRKALSRAPRDYTGLVLMAKCQLAQKNGKNAGAYARDAIAVSPQEAQAHHICGVAELMQEKYDTALERFTEYERILPGNPNTIFLQGLSYEGMNRRREAAERYARFLDQVQEGEQAKHAYTRLVEWGYIKPAE
ncbi:MAG: M48 family metalloprotease [Desulfovibrionales bacterium]